MAHIHKETYDIIQESNIEGLLDDYFEVDDLIALPIQALNKKGYKTLFCCAGHAFDELNEAFCLEETTVEQSPFVGTFKVEKVCAEEDGKRSFRILFRQSNRTAYIVFDNGIKLPNLPKGFCLDGNAEDGDHPIKVAAIDEDGNEIPSPLEGTIRMTACYENDLPVYKFYAKVLEDMTCLYEWVLALPAHD